ncbi:hypothetical protein [Anaeroselena agilis]|uniref:Uncharacterized protein n=1 Tax=Anaeroselena agilis TaxID=3063788 RepID=A0ABU3P1D0_9FIRM|nr:hypothetical protein [Selenomonadales bacterium 4137-cl]
MAKIPKNRHDSEMFAGVREAVSFEHLSDGTAEEPAAPAAKTAKKEAPKPAWAEFFTPELQEEVGKALLTLKVNLYKQGIVDYALKAALEGDKVVLKALPKQPKQPKQR